MSVSVLYSGKIWILQTSVAYRREVERYLRLVQTTRIGRGLIKFINTTPRQMLIMPFKPTRDDPVNAYAYPASATERDAYPKDYLMWRDFTLPNGIVIRIPHALGTGKGSLVYIDFHPATWRQRAINTGGIAPGAGPGETLFHEMTHGFRMMAGKLAIHDGVPANPQMDNIEEFFAIAASNVYRSERGFTSLRANHHEWSRLTEHTHSDDYYEHYQTEIDRWFKEQKPFCMELAASPAKFNPFRSAAIAQGFMPEPAVPMRLP